MEHLIQIIDELHRNHGLIMLKGGTEWENMDFEEIAFLNSLVLNKVPVLVKVGGVEARTDIRNLKNLGVGGILGPLIESEYALEKFVSTVNEIFYSEHEKPILAINIETKNAFKEIDNILGNSAFNHIDMVVIGRLDLSLSMGKQNVDDVEVSEVIQKIIDKLNQKNIHILVGGFVNPQSAALIKENYKVSRINTIHAVFDLSKISNISHSIIQALNFEIELYETFKLMFPKRNLFYENRIKINRDKLSPDRL